MDSVEHRVEMFLTAQERRKSGQPVWDQTVKGVKTALEDYDGDVEPVRDAVVAALRTSSWFKGQDEYSDLRNLVDEMSECDDENTFDYLLQQMYDIADYERAWIE